MESKFKNRVLQGNLLCINNTNEMLTSKRAYGAKNSNLVMKPNSCTSDYKAQVRRDSKMAARGRKRKHAS
jgi:hypothetical protein